MFRSALALLALSALALPTPAPAGEGLGFTGFAADLTASDWGRSVSASVDVAITGHHGFEGALGLADTARGTLGTLSAHLYLAPDAAQKLGLFVFAGDLDGRSATYGGVGAEGWFALSEDVSLNAHAGLGLTHRTGFDFVFAGADAAWDMGGGVAVTGGVAVAEYDEATMQGWGYELSVGLDYTPPGSAVSVRAGLVHDGIEGLGGGETRAVLGLRFATGSAAGPAIRPRSFGSPDPLGPLLSRGLF